jgi:hypothetical protein
MVESFNMVQWATQRLAKRLMVQCTLHYTEKDKWKHHFKSIFLCVLLMPSNDLVDKQQQSINSHQSFSIYAKAQLDIIILHMCAQIQ